MYYVVIVGTAGSGKTALTAALSDWMEDQQLSVTRVNLDPAAEWLPYSPDVDVRDYVSARDVMKKYNLGPNGALIASVDLLVNHVKDLREEIASTRSNYVIVDTPGQLELFAMRPSGPLVLEELIGGARAVAVFLIDAFFAERPSSLVSALLLASSVNLRLKIPQVAVVSKADLLPEDVVSKLEELSVNAEALLGELMNERGDPEVISMASRLLEALGEAGMYPELVPVSSYTSMGLDTLYARLQQVLAGGEDFLTEEPSGRL